MAKGWITDYYDVYKLPEAQVFGLIASNVKSTSLGESYEYLSKVQFVDKDGEYSRYLERVPAWTSVELRFVLNLAWDYLDRFCDMVELLFSEASGACVPTLFKCNEQEGMFSLFVRRIPGGEQLFKALSSSNSRLFAQSTLFKAGEYFLRAFETDIFGTSRSTTLCLPFRDPLAVFYGNRGLGFHSGSRSYMVVKELYGILSKVHPKSDLWSFDRYQQALADYLAIIRERPDMAGHC
jgi:hypothetical protein